MADTEGGDWNPDAEEQDEARPKASPEATEPTSEPGAPEPSTERGTPEPSTTADPGVPSAAPTRAMRSDESVFLPQARVEEARYPYEEPPEYSWRKSQFFDRRVQQIQPTTDVVALVEAMRETSAQGRQLAAVCDILKRALEDEDRPTVILATAGTLLSTGMRDLFVALMRAGFIDAWVSTGGCIDDDLYLSLGGPVGQGRPTVDNLLLRYHMIDRLHDSYIDEDFLRACDGYVSYVADSDDLTGFRTSRELTHYLGWCIRERRDFNGLTPQQDGVLSAVNELEVPLWIPALTDSSMGIGLCINHWRHVRAETDKTFFHDPIADNWELTQLKGNSKKSCVIYLGGGVPKNFVNDCEVVCETTEYTDREGHEYAVQITMDRPEWNGLSGSTLEEAQAWGKVHAQATKATCYSDVLLAWPIVANYLLATCKPREPLRPKWEGHRLVELGGKPVAAREGHFDEAPPPPGTVESKSWWDEEAEKVDRTYQ